MQIFLWESRICTSSSGSWSVCKFQRAKMFASAACFVIRVYSFFLLVKLRELINPHRQSDTQPRHKLHLNLRWQWSEQSFGRLQHKSFWYDRAVQNLQIKKLHLWLKKNLMSVQQGSFWQPWCDVPLSIGALENMKGPLMGAGLFLLQVEWVPSCPFPPSPNEYIFPEEGVKASVCCLVGFTEFRHFAV